MLFALAGGLAYVVRARGIDRMLMQGPRLGAPPSTVSTPWKTEEEWLAGEVARDIVEMAFYARHRRPPAAGEATAQAKVAGAPGAAPIRITITTKGAPEAAVELPLTFLWGPGEYVPMVRLAAERLGLAAAATPDVGTAPVGAFVALTEPTVGVLEAENQRVSAMLAARPQDPAAHESAALVLAALALREAAGLSHDLRPALCRMAAHLAIAEAWRRGPPTADGRIALAALLVLAQRGAEAESATVALPGATPAEAAWREALFMRATDDWRRSKDPGRATLLEQMAYVRAIMRTGTEAAVLDHLAAMARGEDDYRELARIAMEDKTLLTVEAGNSLLELGRATEEQGLAQAHGAARGAPLGDRARSLADPPDRCITAAGPRVIGWGTWSAYFRRHLLHQLTADEMHTRHMLGLPAAADAKGKAYDALYGSVPQYSFVQDRRESHAGIRPTRFAESIAYTIEQPEQITAFNFFVTEDLAAREVIRRGPAPRAGWFAPPLPRGTTFDFRMRWQALGFEPKGETLEALRVVSPRDPTVIGALGIDHPKGSPIAELERKLGPRIDYDVTLLRTLAQATGDDREQLLLVNRRLCAVGARWCGALGVFLAEEGRDDEAAAELHKTFDAAADRVGATYYAPWLVRYYTDRRQWDKAEAVAREAGSVGSGSGLIALRMFLERRGRFEEAEAVLLQMRARYGDDARADPPEEDDDDHLIAFYHRMANVRGESAYAERFRTMAARAFPSGVEKLDPAALTPEAAREGVAILKESGTTRRVGLKPGDVIVGVDGHRVRTARQYSVARLMSETPEMRLHVWRYPGFREIPVRTWWRWLDTDLRTNVPGEPTTPG